MHLSLAPYEIVFHASDDSSITQVELQINDQGIAVPPLSDVGKNLVTVKYPWSPSAPGEYVLRARSQNDSGAWSDEAIVTVWVGDLTPTATQTPIVTSSPTVIITPTLTATQIVTASPTSTPTLAGLTFTHSVSTNQFYYGRCSPTTIDLEVKVSGGDVDSVVLFVKLNDQSGSGSTGWISYNAMKPINKESYKITVPSSRIEGFDNYRSAWMVYQFVATKNNLVVGRSESFTDVVLSACSASPLVPPARQVTATTIPTNTPQIIK